MRRVITVVGALALASSSVTLVPARADHVLLHACGEQAAVARFPEGFPELIDEECDFVIGGFGGRLDDDPRDLPEPVDHHPVVFVHGNVVDHADWYPVRDGFLAAGWDPDDLWALSYNGLGNNSGSAGGTQNPKRDAEHAQAGGDGLPRNTSNEINVADLATFVDEVLSFTGEERFSVVAHSLGVTLARRTLEVRPDLAEALVAFVGIAGANHGTSLCPPGSSGRMVACDEVEQGSEWLGALNSGPEEFDGAPVMTVYDGSGAADSAYVGPTHAHSPMLGDVYQPALDCIYPGRGHNDLRLSPGIVEGYRLFIEAATAESRGEGTRLEECPPDPLGLR